MDNELVSALLLTFTSVIVAFFRVSRFPIRYQYEIEKDELYLYDEEENRPIKTLPTNLFGYTIDNKIATFATFGLMILVVATTNSYERWLFVAVAILLGGVLGWIVGGNYDECYRRVYLPLTREAGAEARIWVREAIQPIYVLLLILHALIAGLILFSDQGRQHIEFCLREGASDIRSAKTLDDLKCDVDLLR